jgi:ATP-binding cassette subfamily F protein 3
MLHLNDVTLRIGGRLLLEQASVHLPASQRIGLVGANGSGKTSLLRLILGELSPDAGEVRLRRHARVGWVAQEAPGGTRTPRDAVLDADRERARLLHAAATAVEPHAIAEIQIRLAEIGAHAAPARSSAILAGLGFDEAAQQRPLSSFSGGWRMRVALAAVLFAEPDLLLLDEPTNHLDLEASLWLEDYLRRYPKTLLLVSHDRGLLNRVPERIVHLDQRKLTAYAGGYDAFERARREKLALQAKEGARIEARRRHMQAFVDRFRYKASKARQAQSRLKAIAKLAPIPEVIEAPHVVLRFPQPKLPPPPLITLERAAAGYGDHVVLDRLDLRLDPDDRIALLGANGNGKSTFAKLLAGELAPLSGEVTRAPKLRVGYFAQHQIEALRPADSPLQHLARRLPDERAERLRTRLGGFGLTQDKAELPAGVLSGGEKARLTFALISADAPQFLVLDEPTNHLDMATKEMLVAALSEFEGTMLFVSHDRHFLAALSNRVLELTPDGVHQYGGGYTEYVARTGQEAPGLHPGG